MKILSVVFLLAASTAFVLMGCSENSAVPVAPTDQAVQGAPSPAKEAITNFTMYHFPVAPPVDPNIRLVPGGIWHLKDVELHEYVMIDYGDGNVEVGTMIHYLSSNMDAAGEGPVNGSFTIYLSGGRTWVGTYQGYRSLSLPAPPLPPGLTLPPGFPPYPAYTYELPMKVVAHGRGGTTDGAKLSGTDVIRAYGTPPQAWYGITEGSIR